METLPRNFLEDLTSWIKCLFVKHQKEKLQYVRPFMSLPTHENGHAFFKHILKWQWCTQVCFEQNQLPLQRKKGNLVALILIL